MPATSGRAVVAGYDVFEAPMEVKRRIGYLPESPPVYPDLTVHEYLKFVGKLKGIKGKKLVSTIERAVNRVNLLPVIDRLIRNLSKGFQQRTGLAQALLGNPEVLILDEPTVGLDPRQIGEVRNLIKEHPQTRKDYFLVHVNQLAASSIDVLLYCFFKVPDWNVELAARESLILSIMRLANDLNVSFAFPTQTIHVEKSIPSTEPN